LSKFSNPSESYVRENNDNPNDDGMELVGIPSSSTTCSPISSSGGNICNNPNYPPENNGKMTNNTKIPIR